MPRAQATQALRLSQAPGGLSPTPLWAGQRRAHPDAGWVPAWMEGWLPALPLLGSVIMATGGCGECFGDLPAHSCCLTWILFGIPDPGWARGGRPGGELPSGLVLGRGPWPDVSNPDAALAPVGGRAVRRGLGCGLSSMTLRSGSDTLGPGLHDPLLLTCLPRGPVPSLRACAPSVRSGHIPCETPALASNRGSGTQWGPCAQFRGPVGSDPHSRCWGQCCSVPQLLGARAPGLAFSPGQPPRPRSLWGCV